MSGLEVGAAMAQMAMVQCRNTDTD